MCCISLRVIAKTQICPIAGAFGRLWNSGWSAAVTFPPSGGRDGWACGGAASAPASSPRLPLLLLTLLFFSSSFLVSFCRYALFLPVLNFKHNHNHVIPKQKYQRKKKKKKKLVNGLTKRLSHMLSICWRTNMY